MRNMTKEQVIKRRKACTSIGEAFILTGIIGAFTISSPTGGVTVYNIVSVALLGIGAFLVELASPSK